MRGKGDMLVGMTCAGNRIRVAGMVTQSLTHYTTAAGLFWNWILAENKFSQGCFHVDTSEFSERLQSGLM